MQNRITSSAPPTPRFRPTWTGPNRPKGVWIMPIAPIAVARSRFSPPTPLHNRCLTAAEALTGLSESLADGHTVDPLVVICGPGDPLATPELTLQTIQAIKERFPDLPVSLQTMGLGSAQLAGSLARAGLSLVEILVDGVQAAVLEKIYAWIRPGLRTLPLGKAIKQLLEDQRFGVPALKFHGLEVVVHTTLYTGINLDHLAKISREMAELGADAIALSPYTSVVGSEVVLSAPDKGMVDMASAAAIRHLPVVPPLLSDASPEREPPQQRDSGTPKPTAERPFLAVVSNSGMDIDIHLGQAKRFLIYGPGEAGPVCLLGTRPAPAAGQGEERWKVAAATLTDCFVLLAEGAGETPRRILAEQGLPVLLSSAAIDVAVDRLYGGGKKGCLKRLSSAPDNPNFTRVNM
jgi:nitrogen fixation protein NifB